MLFWMLLNIFESHRKSEILEVLNKGQPNDCRNYCSIPPMRSPYCDSGQPAFRILLSALNCRAFLCDNLYISFKLYIIHAPKKFNKISSSQKQRARKAIMIMIIDVYDDDILEFQRQPTIDITIEKVNRR
jgi:hypothetical protein